MFIDDNADNTIRLLYILTHKDVTFIYTYIIYIYMLVLELFIIFENLAAWCMSDVFATYDIHLEYQNKQKT